ncbi:MAG: hypothetical protein ACXAAP_14930 [Candidatus Thorarchaeota archaeon]
MKLSRLQSIANNAVRNTIWSHKPSGMDPLAFMKPAFTITIDLVSGTITPDMEGDSVEQYYTTMSRWFHDVLKKEEIPIDVIERATITITPDEGKKCVILAQGRTFESTI